MSLGAFLSSYEVAEASVTLAHPAEEVGEAVHRRSVPPNKVKQQIQWTVSRRACLRCISCLIAYGWRVEEAGGGEDDQLNCKWQLS